MPNQAAALVRAVQATVGMSHSARLAEVENAIRAGTYAPSASELASRAAGCGPEVGCAIAGHAERLDYGRAGPSRTDTRPPANDAGAELEQARGQRLLIRALDTQGLFERARQRSAFNVATGAA